MVRGKFVFDNEDIAIVEGMRKFILTEECHLTQPVTHEATNMELLIYNSEDVPVGCGCVGLDDNLDFFISGVCILPAYRRKQYGTFLTKILIDKALMSHAQVIHLEAISGTEDFFKTLGFNVSGEAYQKYGTTILPMQLTADSIHKCCSCGHN